ncbi:bifunctional (p)ppGpp synthetase/guanosine-3',5'-bis(diphosphate) 3'-pyrophosphohydrolase [Candidatus Woesearchaeota archaeon]|jgi:GTP diphosphokinase / guanosine-3',5'-bis(diphosphate) 3'-diphosphatase|nr:bifunctional (p)ppGpp synthetase/guanosine-3',5'-bis(diphosphate) 3'-pyrophosphohydrolase [Candidatus Woesearchaeota archaeon]MBT5397103.1 bifunctional (p)ppGpp synthetase/guanosine-3',5'-bis(diphosphate) 3'-pyrophosphohydrolase [Candidatus Woesearchaeota archaeon]MBT5924765.1 bifunctional (p)ppGpp synthetase/guanosine-3',5'-bis(diphosphate) 3'-pyrophosphohydrolase [Candidatus Woesearchaeota archaeon]MBT6367351.1 bifunctional (p)ppGpp synthetase/guanosine-3',5'-bis(diphosphate) 3'-pyrophospho
MHVNEFRTSCELNKYPQEKIHLFQKAIDIARTTFSEKKRIAGDSFFDHNMRVATILTESNSEAESVIAGILQGILPHMKKEELKIHFGTEIVRLLEEVDELKEIKSRNNQLSAESLRKIIITTAQDIRSIFVKFANKLDNMRSIIVLPQAEQKKIAQDVLDIYAPLAYRLGAERIRTQLEDIAFKVLNPRKSEEIITYLEESREQRQKSIDEAITLIQRTCSEKVDIIKIKGRPKHVYSIYKKIQAKKVGLNQLFDLLGLRVIVAEEKDCYTLLGILHEAFEPSPGRLKDFIATPKPNFYRSIHTGVMLPNGKVAEVQIRTPEMEEFAEEGLASHWRYKKIKSDDLFERRVAWLRNVLEMQKNLENKELLQTIKVDLFGDKIYCYTPKGDVKELPKNATILDFAYLVHEHIGNKTVGARVNGRFVPIKHKLISGDVVEIVTNKNQRPRRSWIKIVLSAKARQRIRKSLKEYEKLPALYFRRIKPSVTEEQGVLVQSEDFPKAVCVLAKCCRAIPDEEIVGIITKRKIISVHTKECKAALKEEERWIPVQWKDTFNQRIRFYVRATERSGLLADLLHTIVNAKFEVKEAKAKMIGENVAECSFSVIPRDLDHLKELIRRLGKVNGFKRISFE